jgi:hypothetical protein
MNAAFSVIALSTWQNSRQCTVPCSGHLALQVMGLVVGFGAIGIAVRLALRISRHQKVWPRNSRTPAAAWPGRKNAFKCIAHGSVCTFSQNHTGTARFE